VIKIAVLHPEIEASWRALRSGNNVNIVCQALQIETMVKYVETL
jgi:hypothetical protein